MARRMVTALLALALAACRGDGPEDLTGFAKDLQGTWTRCGYLNAPPLAGDWRDLCKFSGRAFLVQSERYSTVDGNCGGPLMDSFGASGTFAVGRAVDATIAGGQVVVAYEVEEKDATGASMLWLMYIDPSASPARLHMGSPTSGVLGDVFTRQ